MSTVCVEIGDDYVTMAGDRQASQDSWGIHEVTKVWQIRQTLVGLTGECGKGLQVVNWMEEGSIKANFPTKEVEGGNFILLVWNGESLGTFDDQGFFVEVEETKFAIGCGAQAARAALLMGARPEEAIAIASQIDEHTGMGFNVVRVAL